MTSDSPVSTVYEFDAMDRDLICGFVADSYWGMGREHEQIVKSIENSYPVGLFDGQRQVAFARAISDQCYLAYVCDVFVIEPYRGRGLSVRIMNDLMNHPKLSAVSKWMLAGYMRSLDFRTFPAART